MMMMYFVRIAILVQAALQGATACVQMVASPGEVGVPEARVGVLLLLLILVVA